MVNEDRLTILWTTADEITSEKMVMMYGINSKMKHWWKEVTIVIWGASNTLVEDSEMIREKIKMAIHTGVKVSACKACADQLGTTAMLEDLGVEVKYWGEGLTEILKEDGKLLTL